tara:strand:- start:45769 stop:46107 length:339 start_codon:yes stop_codon:yes gene_type:complete
MGFLKDTMEDKEPDEEEGDAKSLEKTYQRLFMKIGRDFVHKDDFVSVIEAILDIVDPDNEHRIYPRQRSNAMTWASIYKEMLDEGTTSDMVIHDLINLDEQENEMVANPAMK